MIRTLTATLVGASLALCASAAASADLPATGWPAPFGGSFSANFTVATEYTQSGISQTQLTPAVQAGLDYRGPTLEAPVPLWLYASLWGSNIDFPGIGSGAEIQVLGGLKGRLLDRKLSFDIGYVEHVYPGLLDVTGASLDYGEISLSLGYNFGFATLGARVRYSGNGIADSGVSWNRRLLAAVPLPFLKVNDRISFEAYGSVGNVWIEKPLAAGIPSPDYWYWQFGIITHLYGIDLNLAYTDTNIEPAGCQYTRYCSARVFAALTKVF
ncbi:MAG: TorF family putative porin [Proteobacteria bacterium]|nr:TorF family putative porin [Pseudomonadota bacterium]